MIYIAEIDTNGIVLRVTVAAVEDYNGLTPEQWAAKNLGGTWIRTSNTGSIRKNYAGIGYRYDKDRDAFIPPKPHNSWILDEQTCRWKAPVNKPDDGYFWDEDKLNWIKAK